MAIIKWKEVSTIEETLYVLGFKDREDGLICYVNYKGFRVFQELEKAKKWMDICSKLQTYNSIFDFIGTPSYPEMRILSFTASNFKEVE